MGQYVTDVGQAAQFAEAMQVVVLVWLDLWLPGSHCRHIERSTQAAALDLGLDGMDLDVEDSGAGADVQVASILLIIS